MPTVPISPNVSGTGQSPLNNASSPTQPSQSDLLMAAAQMHSMNRLTTPNPSPKGKKHKLAVVK